MPFGSNWFGNTTKTRSTNPTGHIDHKKHRKPPKEGAFNGRNVSATGGHRPDSKEGCREQIEKFKSRRDAPGTSERMQKFYQGRVDYWEQKEKGCLSKDEIRAAEDQQEKAFRRAQAERQTGGKRESVFDIMRRKVQIHIGLPIYIKGLQFKRMTLKFTSNPLDRLALEGEIIKARATVKLLKEVDKGNL